MPAILSPDEQREFWNDLVDFARERALVPIVGADLLDVPVQGGARNFYTIVAEKLAQQMGVDPPQRIGTVALNEVARRCIMLKPGTDVHAKVRRLVRELQASLPLPPALLDLCALCCPLIVTTTCDDLLVRALEDRHPAWKGQISSIDYSPERPRSFTGFAAVGTPTVFHLFGRALSMDSYALTDEDMLEFMLALQSHDRRPEELLRALHREYLIFIGCGLPDWVSRFFVRLGKQERFSAPGAKTEWLVDGALGDSEFVTFLDSYSRRTRCFPIPAAHFVAQMREHLSSVAPPDIDRNERVRERDPERDILREAVFLSYASEDRALAERIAAALEAHNIDCWFDRKQLIVGDDWRRKIRDNLGASRPAITR